MNCALGFMNMKIRGIAAMIAAVTLIVGGDLYALTNPCPDPFTYSIGQIDQRFSLSRWEVQDAVRRAADIWGQVYACELFTEQNNAAITIDLVYDYRQAATDRLKTLRNGLDYSKGSYDELVLNFKSQRAEYERRKQDYETDNDVYAARVCALKVRIESARRNGEPTLAAYRQMRDEKRTLDAKLADLKKRRSELMEAHENLKSLTYAIDTLATKLNLTLDSYAETGSQIKEEFREATCRRVGNRYVITVYQFNSRDQLIRVLAHEFGHAMGLTHNDNTQAIMYRLNNSNSMSLAPEDIDALEARFKSR